MNAKTLKALLSGGQFFSVEYVKKNGETRILNGRIGVKKSVNGKGLKYNPIERGLLPVYDVRKRNYRMINIKTVRVVRAHGDEIIINGDKALRFYFENQSEKTSV